MNWNIDNFENSQVETQPFSSKNLVVPSVSDILHQIKGALEQWVGSVTFQGEISEIFSISHKRSHVFHTERQRGPD